MSEVEIVRTGLHWEEMRYTECPLRLAHSINTDNMSKRNVMDYADCVGVLFLHADMFSFVTGCLWSGYGHVDIFKWFMWMCTHGVCVCVCSLSLKRLCLNTKKL